jgi:pimeloyl-ACP methyl ester carboxylesterase
VAQWNVIGGSYGTRAGLEYLRQFPQATRRAVLDGLAPPDGVLPRSMSLDVQTALDTLLQSCSTEPGCEAAFPKLQAQWQQLLASLPREVTVRHPLSGKPETVRLEASHVINAVRGPLYVPALRSALPAAISQAAQGSFDALVGLSSAMSSGRGMRLAGGMHFSVVCAEDMPRMAQSQEQGRDTQAMTQVYERICKTWPRGEVPPAFYEMPKAQSAVLLLSGGADPVTPPRHGERVQKALGAKAKHEVVPAAGHGVMGLPCMRDTLARFIEAKTDEEALAVKTDCAAKMPLPLAFVPPNPELPALPKKEAEVKK